MIPRFRAFIAAAVMIGGMASAHHSFSMFDSSHTITLHGTVRSFQWSNPHALLLVQADAASDPETRVWAIELPTSPANLKRLGWNKHSLNPGDDVDVAINPLRDGRAGGSFLKATQRATNVVLLTDMKQLAGATP